MVQKFPNLLVLEEAGTETDSPVLRAYGLVCATRRFADSDEWNFLRRNYGILTIRVPVKMKFQEI